MCVGMGGGGSCPFVNKVPLQELAPLCEQGGGAPQLCVHAVSTSFASCMVQRGRGCSQWHHSVRLWAVVSYGPTAELNTLVVH